MPIRPFLRTVPILLSSLMLGCDGGASTAPTTVPPVNQRTTASFERRMVNLGQVIDAGTYKAVFPVTNTGQHDLFFVTLKPECSCATAVYHPAVIEPGESGEIEVTVKPASLTGQQNVRINIVGSMEPSAETLTIGMGIIPIVRAGPPVLNFGKIVRGQPMSKIVQFASSDQRMTLETVAASDPNVTCRVLNDQEVAALGLNPLPEGYVRRVAEVTVSPEHPWGELATTIAAQTRVRLDSDSEPFLHEVSVTAFGSVFGEIESSSTTFEVGWIRPGQPFDATVDLRRPSGEAFSILSARIDRFSIRGARVEYEAINDGGVPGYRLHLKGTAPNGTGRIEGLISVITDVSSEGVLSLRAKGGVSAGQ